MGYNGFVNLKSGECVVKSVAEDKNEAMQPEQAAAPVVDAANRPLSEEDRLLLDKHRTTFIGSYSHTLDSKGRIVVPQAFRDMLGAQFCITPSFDFKSISVYPELRYARMRERFSQMAREGTNEKLLTFIEVFDSLSYRGQECDGQGRVLLPARIRQVVLREEKDVEITGAGDHVRIVTRATSDSVLEAFLQNLPDFLQSIGSLPIE